MLAVKERVLFEGLRESVLQAWSADWPGSDWSNAAAWLNGLTSSQVKEHFDPQRRKRDGIFFSGSKRAAALLRGTGRISLKDTAILDPACGAGDLLLAIAKRLPVSDTPSETLEAWGKVLFGWDIDAKLVEATKLRLALLAAARCQNRGADILDLDAILPRVRVLDGEQGLAEYSGFSHIVMNPPFGQEKRTVEGRHPRLISQAAIFLEGAVTALTAGGRLYTLLPDVLRSGSRYVGLRTEIEKSCTIERIELLDQFDSAADVHPFLLELTRCPASTQTNSLRFQLVDTGRESVRDRSEIRVGPLVAYRDREIGPLCPYITSRTLTGKTIFDASIAPKRRFRGALIKPPFIVVRRTSRPGGTPRAISTVILGTELVAVENHLIVVKPTAESIAECNTLARLLRSQDTSQWLDQRIRCRHLTVASIGEIPWR